MEYKKIVLGRIDIKEHYNHFKNHELNLHHFKRNIGDLIDKSPKVTFVDGSFEKVFTNRYNN